MRQPTLKWRRAAVKKSEGPEKGPLFDGSSLHPRTDRPLSIPQSPCFRGGGRPGEAVFDPVRLTITDNLRPRSSEKRFFLGTGVNLQCNGVTSDKGHHDNEAESVRRVASGDFDCYQHMLPPEVFFRHAGKLSAVAVESNPTNPTKRATAEDEARQTRQQASRWLLPRLHRCRYASSIACLPMNVSQNPFAFQGSNIGMQ